MLGFSAWLWLAVQEWLWATVAVFCMMGAALARCLWVTTREPLATWWDRVLVRGLLGIYAGWTSVAIWADTASAVHDAGRGVPNAVGWQAVLLVGATLVAVVGVWAFRATAGFVLAVEWALVAVLVGCLEGSATVLAGVAAAGAAVVAVTAVLVRVRHDLSSPTPS